MNVSIKRVVLVTGGSSGIGARVINDLERSGAHAIAAAIDVEADGLRSTNALRSDAYVDIRSQASVERLFADIRTELGRLDGLVHCAGIGVFGATDAITPDQFADMLQVNVFGAFLCLRAAAGLMTDSGGGRIVALSSVAALRSLPGSGPYGATKAALHRLCLSGSAEWCERSVQCTSLVLGATATSMTAKLGFTDPEKMLTTEEVSSVIVQILQLPLSVRLEEMTLLPKGGVL